MAARSTGPKFGWKLRPPAITSSGTITAVCRLRILGSPIRAGKTLANVMWGVRPAMYVNTAEHHPTIWAVDRFGNIALSTFEVVFRLTDCIIDPDLPYASE
jgi:hypothetical protein